ncbi:MAG: glycosyltransferase family 4 protein [Ruminococcaceae bacterium]|nr:glycosyltransferase family 4 protein [Oscillospiraceae bacterium]
MNILSIGGSYKPENGGNAKRISTMCEAFCKLGHTVTVLTCSGFKSEPVDSSISGVRVVRYGSCNELVKAVPKLSKQVAADVILVQQETFLRMLWLKNIKLPVFYECHAIESSGNNYKEAIRKLLRRFYLDKRFVKGVFVLSKNAIQAFSSKFNYPEEKIYWTPNGFSLSEQDDRALHFGENETFVYGYGGTLYTFQGIENILTYSKDILAIADDVRLMIVGGGPLEQTVRDYVEENDLSERIIITGSVDRERFDTLMATFDVVLMPRPSMPSTESAVPLKIFDAAKHKKPVVMSNVSGLTEAFSEKAALIYDTKQPDEFVTCCQKIYRNRPLAESLVAGELEAMKKWPSVEAVAKIQAQVMENQLR